MPTKDDPTTEAEITPAMIEAGVAELIGYNEDYMSPEEGAERIFRAMTAKRTRAV